MSEGVDYSTSRPNLVQLRASGISFVCRYLALLPNPKVLTGSERVSLHKAGFQILLNWEQRTGDALLGRQKGIDHAREALKQARALGAPESVPIYFSVDQDVTTANQMSAIGAYFDGVASVITRARTGVYGEADVIDAMIPAHASWGWQTYAWSRGRVSSKAHLLQYHNGVTIAGADCDRNRTLKDHIGAWTPGGYADYEQSKGGDTDMELSDQVALPVEMYPAGGASATVGTLLGYMNGRIINLEADVKALKVGVAAILEAVQHAPAPGTVVLPIDGTYRVQKVE